MYIILGYDIYTHTYTYILSVCDPILTWFYNDH